MPKNKFTPFSARKRLIVVAVSACFASAPAWSNPTGPQVVNGSAGIAQAGKLLTVSNSNGAIINWNTFSIGAGETTRFNQASAASSVLNRVLANDPSVLLGTLTSNGKVWLVNPAGILVGQGARIDVAGFVASTLNVRNEDFLANRLSFQATPNAGSVQNYGQISTPSGGSVYIVAPNVENHGTISAPNGEIILVAGQRVDLIDTGTPGVKVEVVGAEGNVTNLGEIVSEAGRIGMAGVLVKNSGTLNASSVVKEGGRIFLKASQDTYVDGSGRITATGTKGGSIEVLGNRVAVMDQAQLDASGSLGGGTVLVGGDAHGANPAVQNAQQTIIGPDAAIRADAKTTGDGGRVIVWSDGYTQFYGAISAQGGSQSGNGGFVETSGKQTLRFAGKVDTRASNGKTGTLLLDPNDIVIADAAAGSQLQDSYGGTIGFTDGLPPNTFTISTGTLEGLSSSTNISLNANNTITMMPISGANTLAPNTLTLQQNGSVSMTTTNGKIDLGSGNTIDIVGTGLLNLSAGSDLTVGPIITHRGSVTLTSGTSAGASSSILLGSSITTNGGNITLFGGPYGTTTGVMMGTLNTSGPLGGSSGNGNVNITTSTGDISIGSIITHALNPHWDAGDVTITTTDGRITVNGDIDASGANGSTVLACPDSCLAVSYGSSGGSVNLIRTGTTNPGIAVNVTGTRGILTYGGDAILGSGSNDGGNGGPVNVYADSSHALLGNITIVGPIDTHGGSGADAVGGIGGLGGRGGDVSLYANGSVTTGGINTFGGGTGNSGVGYGSNGGDGGFVTIHGSSITVNGSIQTWGGKGGDGYSAGRGGWGRDVAIGADNVNVFGVNDTLLNPVVTTSVTVHGSIDTHGGNGGNGLVSSGAGGGGDGRDGGSVTIAGTGAITVDESILTYGGAGGNGADGNASFRGGDGGEGGSGGHVSLYTGSGITVSGAINTSGGIAGNGGAYGGRGGNNDSGYGFGGAGNVTLAATSGNVNFHSIVAVGGNGGQGRDGGGFFAGGYGGYGGQGGNVSITGGVIGISSGGTGAIMTRGGTGGSGGSSTVYGGGSGGIGGGGGYVDVSAAGGGGSVNIGGIDTRGGNGGAGGAGAAGFDGFGGSGGSGGYVTISGGSIVIGGGTGTILATGGNGGPGASGGYGGSGGNGGYVGLFTPLLTGTVATGGIYTNGGTPGDNIASPGVNGGWSITGNAVTIADQNLDFMSNLSALTATSAFEFDPINIASFSITQGALTQFASVPTVKFGNSTTTTNLMLTGTIDLPGISKTLNLITQGAITQQDSSPGDATLAVTNLFAQGGSVSLLGAALRNNVVNLGGGAISGNFEFYNANALKLGALNLGTGTLTIAAGGTITQSGPIVQAAGAGQASFLTTAPGGSAVTLSNAGNDFTGPVKIDSGIQPTIVTDANSIIIRGGGGGSGGGDITINANGMVSQSGVFTGTVGNVVVNAGAGPIVFTDPGNNFAATGFSATSAGAVSLVNAAATNLGASTIGGALSLTTGAVTQSGAITVGGTSTINGGANPITLTNAGNHFTGAVSLNNSGANSVVISNSGSLTLAASSLGSGALTVNAVGIAQSGAVTQAAAAGAATFNAGAGVISLANAGNDFTGAVSLNNSGVNNVAITDANAIQLGTLATGSGTLTVNASGAITQTGAITQAAGAGAATFNAGANPIALSNAGNDFTGAVSLNDSGANNAAVTDTNAIQLGTSAVGGGTLAVNAVSITQSGAIVASALATTSVTGTNLTGAGNQVSSFTATNSGSGNVALTNTVPLTIGGISNAGGNITVNNTGGITTVGAVSAPAGAVSIVAHSPLAIGTGGVLAGGNIILTAGGTSLATDNMTLNGVIQTTGSAGSIALSAGGSIMSVAGFSGANLIGDQAFIVAGGNASLSTAVRLLDVNVSGTFSIFDFLTGTFFTNVPNTSTLPVLNQVLSSVAALTLPPLLTTPFGDWGSALLINSTQTIGGTEGTFGGDSGDNPAAGRRDDGTPGTKKLATCS